MANTLESHGGLPNVDEDVQFHQKIIFGSQLSSANADISDTYREIPNNFYPELKPYLPIHVAAIDMKNRFTGLNRDMTISLEEVHLYQIPRVTQGFIGDEESEIELKALKRSNTISLYNN